MKKKFTISLLCISLSASLMQAGGLAKVKLRKKGSELQTEIQEIIAVESTIEIRKPTQQGFFCFQRIADIEGMCQLEIIHPEEVMMVTYTVANEAQFYEIAGRLSNLLKPYIE